MRGKWKLLNVALTQILCIGANIAVGQELLLSENLSPPQTATASQTDSSHTRPDSAARPTISISSALQRIRTRLDAGYRAAPIHPYFRDGQRVINDMRRLVFMADPNAIRGLESIPELVAIAQRLPAAKQTAIIRLAAAGSMANVAAENVMKHIRRHKLDFVRIEVEKVLCQTQWRGAHLSLARGLDKQTYTVSVPKLRATYSRADYAKFASHSFHLSPLNRLTLNYNRWNTVDIFSVFYARKGGVGVVSHDYTQNITLYGCRLQKDKNWLGLFFLQNRRVPAGNWLRADVSLVW